MYTDRHTNSIAAMLREFRDRFADTSEGAQHYGWLVGRFAKTFAISNPQFDREVFDRACGWTEYIDAKYEKVLRNARP